MKLDRHRRTLAAAAACLSLCMPAGALADSSRAQATGAPSEAADAATAARWQAKARYYERNGATPASQPVAPAPAATHDPDDQPALLPAVAVLVALAGGGFALLRTRSRPRGALGRSQ